MFYFKSLQSFKKVRVSIIKKTEQNIVILDKLNEDIDNKIRKINKKIAVEITYLNKTVAAKIGKYSFKYSNRRVIKSIKRKLFYKVRVQKLIEEMLENAKLISKLKDSFSEYRE